MVGILKAIGIGLLKGSGVVAGFGPILKPVTPDAVDKVIDTAADIKKIADTVAITQAMGGAINADGATKLKMATPVVTQILLQSALLRGRKIAEPEKFARGMASITSGFADVLDAVEDE